MTDGGSLTGALYEKLAQAIADGEFAPGTRIPTQRDIAAREKVSRTVVREAVARLEARGLAVARRGSGVFVAEGAAFQPFQITRDEIAALKDVMNLLELRVGVEAEMAALAAARRNADDIARLTRLLDAMAAASADPDAATALDADFHRAIARATRNDYYLRLIDFLGARVVPPRRLYLRLGEADGRAYAARVHAEHEAILAAIVRMDVARAREAARAHLQESIARHAELGGDGNGRATA